jgi:acyl carrier protein
MLIAEIFEEILGLTNIGIDQEFFEIGGNSLLAVKLADRIRLMTKSKINVQSIIKHPTVASLASLVSANGKG